MSKSPQGCSSPGQGVSRLRSSTSHLSKDGGVEEEGHEKGEQKFVSIGSKLFHSVDEYWGDLVGQEAGVSSCQEGLNASGHVTN